MVIGVSGSTVTISTPQDLQTSASPVFQNVTAQSDERVKINIRTIENALDKVMLMRGVIYQSTIDGLENTGVIAQEIQQVLPMVVRSDEKGMLSVAYGNIVGVLIEAIKELKTSLDEVKKKLP
jgi:hypothetical protein